MVGISPHDRVLYILTLTYVCTYVRDKSEMITN